MPLCDESVLKELAIPADSVKGLPIDDLVAKSAGSPKPFENLKRTMIEAARSKLSKSQVERIGDCDERLDDVIWKGITSVYPERELRSKFVTPTPISTQNPDSPTPPRTSTATATPTAPPVKSRPGGPSYTSATVEQPSPIDPKSGGDPKDLLLASLAFAAAAVLSIVLAKKLIDRLRFGKNAYRNLKQLKRAIRATNDLTKNWLKKRRSANIHAIGVGKIDGTDDYCIQVFVDDANADMLEDPPTQLLPAEYRNLPIVIYEMPRAEAFSSADARREHEVMVGGISAANAKLGGEFGTIGYFFRPKLVKRARQAFLRNDVYMLSNAHVFADLSGETPDEADFIVHPSPGDSPGGRAVAELVAAAPIDFTGDVDSPNLVDAAIARVGRNEQYRTEIAGIGRIAGFLRRDSIVLRSEVRKSGRTTGLTRGRVFSIHLSIWVKYGASNALFSEQFLIVPTDGSSFVKPGDSGSLVVDDESRALGLIFAGAGENADFTLKHAEATDLRNIVINQAPRIESFGVANAISDVMKAFGIKLDR